jgi:hypothetical protein
MLDTVGVLRVEYGAALVAILDMVLRLCADPVVGRGVPRDPHRGGARAHAADRGAHGGAGRRDGARVDRRPLALRWPDVVTPSWGDISSAIDAATKATGGRAVLSQRAAMRLVAPAAGAGGPGRREPKRSSARAAPTRIAMRETIAAVEG